MRVITGEARGRNLQQPQEADVRVTAGRVKEAVFSIIQFDIMGRRVLDLFAGSGQMGIEALSRGADFAVFVDNSKVAVDTVRQNLKTTGFTEKSKLLAVDALWFLKTSNDKFDIVFLDPPFSRGMVEKALPLLDSLLAEGGLIVCETSSQETLPDKVLSLEKQKEYKYSNTKITVYRN